MHDRLVKGGVDRVDGDRIVGVGGVARDIDNDGQVALVVEHLGGEERGDGLVKVDTVDKDLGLEDAGEGASGLGLGHVPLDNLGLGDADGAGEIASALAAAAQGAHDHDLWDLVVVEGD